MFRMLQPKEIETEVETINSTIVDTNTQNKESHRRVVTPVSKSGYLIFHALLISLTVHFQQGEKLRQINNSTCKKKIRKGLSKVVDFSKWMKW